MKRTHVLFIIAGIVITAAVVAGPMASNVEQAKYTVAETHGTPKNGTIEIRDYAPMIVAEALVKGERKEAINEGFGIIADYIFGNNTARQDVAMTAPVMQQTSETIAMTAPVMQQAEGGMWVVRFVMPAEYSMESLPKPTNDAVTLKTLEARRFAVIRFSGTAGQERIGAHEDALRAFMEAKGLKAGSEPVYAFFNPPWTLPFLRRNEVMVEIAR